MIMERNLEIVLWKDSVRKKNINQDFTIPYFHEENGRIERANRIIRTALNKESGKIKERLEKVINNYNKTYHRRIGMTPEEALNKENNLKVWEHQTKYMKEFGVPDYNNQFKINDEVYIRIEKRV